MSFVEPGLLVRKAKLDQHLRARKRLPLKGLL
jgi:hypothetical protein